MAMKWKGRSAAAPAELPVRTVTLPTVAPLMCTLSSRAQLSPSMVATTEGTSLKSLLKVIVYLPVPTYVTL